MSQAVLPPVLPPKKFRITAKKAFFTWPQCPVTKEECLKQLYELLSHWELLKYRICEEKHQDGSPHLHAYVQCLRKISTTIPTFVDLVWEGVTYHGNYQSCRNPHAVKQYCQKGDNPNFIDNLDDNMFTDLIEIAKKHGTKRAISQLAEINAEMYVREGKRIKSNLELAVPPAIAKKVEDFRFVDLPIEIMEWQRFRKEFALWLKGPTCLGKTSLAISFFEHPLLIRHIDQLK